MILNKLINTKYKINNVVLRHTHIEPAGGGSSAHDEIRMKW